MYKGINEEVDIISLNLLLARNIENSYLNNCLGVQKLDNLYSIPNNSLYGNLNSLQTIHGGFNPILIMANIQNFGNLNSLLTFSNLNQNAKMSSYNNYANFNNCNNNNEKLNVNSSNVSSKEKIIKVDKTAQLKGKKAVMVFIK
jgi:hypothetical protein